MPLQITARKATNMNAAKENKDCSSQSWRLPIAWLALITFDLCLVALVCAPTISQAQINFLEVSLNEYVWTRKRIFDVNLRPKHHFLLHYGELIRQLGPLMRLWTMRFESKHGYFKKCLRSSKNFRNLCQSLSFRHQLNVRIYVNPSF